VGPRNHVLNGGADRQGEKAILGVCSPIEKHWEPLQRKSICWFLSRSKFGGIRCSGFDNMQVSIRCCEE